MFLRVLLCPLPLAFFLCLAAAPHTAAWEASGHRVVARIAWEFLTPTARAEVTRLLQGEDFVAVSTWSDEVVALRRNTAAWHVARIPITASTYDGARDCQMPYECVAAKVRAFPRAFALPPGMMGSGEQRDFLKHLIHLVADLHQPLACVDRDGRDVRVAAGDAPAPPPTTLYALWTRDLVNRPGITEGAYVQSLLKDLSARPVPEEKFNPDDWATESHRLAVEVAHGYPGALTTRPAEAPVAVDSAYVEKARAVIDRQLGIAAVRLARILNTSFSRR